VRIQQEDETRDTTARRMSTQMFGGKHSAILIYIYIYRFFFLQIKQLSNLSICERCYMCMSSLVALEMVRLPE